MTAIRLHGAGKSYSLYRHDLDRLREVLSGRSRHQSIAALHPTDLEVPAGQVLGIIGANGAGKSTLLKLISGTLQPSTGRVAVKGRLTALLELGAGFHPEMTGRENVYLSGAVMGLSGQEVEALYAEIRDFAGIGEFIDQPVRTYSSGMFVRLAFAVATCVAPEILVIDEALSVGDGAFARRSFERIMSFRDAGKTILFCSHSMYQVEAICSRVLWLHRGRVIMDGDPAQVVTSYDDFVQGGALPPAPGAQPAPSPLPPKAMRSAAPGTARIAEVRVATREGSGRPLPVRSARSDVTIEVHFVSDPALPPPSLAVVFTEADGRMISSAGTVNDGMLIDRDGAGRGHLVVTFPRFALLKGRYLVDVYLLCEQALHTYDRVQGAAELEVTQNGLEQGVVTLPRHWQIGAHRDPACALGVGVG